MIEWEVNAFLLGVSLAFPHFLSIPVPIPLTFSLSISYPYLLIPLRISINIDVFKSQGLGFYGNVSFFFLSFLLSDILYPFLSMSCSPSLHPPFSPAPSFFPCPSLHFSLFSTLSLFLSKALRSPLMVDWVCKTFSINHKISPLSLTISPSLSPPVSLLLSLPPSLRPSLSLSHTFSWFMLSQPLAV